MADPESVGWLLSGFGDEIDADPRVQAAVLQASCGRDQDRADGLMVVA
jgi:hypothetical protein